MDCGLHLEFGSSAHVREVFDRACKNRLPMFGAFDLTYRCNFRCVHCYAGHLVGQSRAAADELTTKQAIDLLRAAADEGCLFMLLSGGEPLLREDFLEIYEAAKRLGLIVSVFTNGSLLTERHADAFTELPPHVVEVSVYGATEATSELVTGVPGSHGRTRRGIELLLERGVPVVLKTMILRDNVQEVGAIEAWASSLGVRFRMDPIVTARLDGDRGPLDQRVDPEEAVAVELAAEARRGEVSEFMRRHLSDGQTDTLPADRLYRCGAGIASFHLDPRGRLHPCLMGLSIEYNVGQMGFGPAWKAVTKAIDEAAWEGVGGCAECADILLCGYCPGLFELEKTTPARPPEYVCQLGRSRYRAIAPESREVVGVTQV